MKRASTIAFTIILLGGMPKDAVAQLDIQVQGGDALLSITSALPGQQPIPVFDASTRLRYRSGTAPRKVTVSTICPGQRFSLSVLAIDLSMGVAAGEVPLTDGMLGLDLITDIPDRPPNGRCTLRYAASSTFEQGNSAELGDDIHTVTYTIADQ